MGQLRKTERWKAASFVLAIAAASVSLVQAQTNEEGRDYLARLDANLPEEQAKAWRDSPGYTQERDNFLNVEYRPALSKDFTRRLMKQARRAARRDSGCRRMQAIASDFGGPLNLDRQVERQVLQGELRNAWTYRVDAEGCGRRYRANFVLVEQMDQSLTTLDLLPGNTVAWPSLQSDALPKIALTSLQTVRLNDPECIPSSRDGVIDTRLETPQNAQLTKMFGVVLDGRWSEVWTMSICGRELDLQVAFRADGRGGAAFQAKPNAAAVTAKESQ